jgi:hypothetical protein
MPGRGLVTWKRVLALLFAIIGIYAAYSGYSLYRLTYVIIPHSYAAWTVGDLLVEYMDTHDGNWPRGWKDLEEAKDGLLRKGRNIYYDFDKLPAVAKIDWTADTASLTKIALATGESGLNVVTQINGSRLEARWGPDTEPNRKVARYLIQRHSRLSTTPSK